MTIVVCGILLLLFSFSNQEILSNVQTQLEEKVSSAREDISYEDGRLKIDSDFWELEHGIYLSLYATDGTLLSGKIPYGFDNCAPFEDRKIRKIQGKTTQYYLLDLIYTIPEYGTIDIRGVTSITAAEQNFIMTMRIAMILLPLLAIFTAILGYYMTGKTLKPMNKIIKTVQVIQKNQDLSQRIALGQGQDEFYQLATTFDELLEQIEKGFLREQQFTSDVAHELRTPLSSMLLLCEDTLEEPSLDPKLRENIILLHRKIKYLTQIISQLLALSRADQGRAKIEKENINLSELAEIAAEELAEIAILKKITIQTNIAPDIFMMGDETLMIRFFMNLLNNAISYGKDNGHIWLTLQRWGEEIKGEIRDDGIGIKEKDLPHIWKRFYQADTSRTKGENAGLGLSMVEWITKAHNGTIQVTSKFREGTCFYFSFPICENKS
ncbi:MAG: sensor histidine kinase [Lachnospiraceae bacterium]